MGTGAKKKGARKNKSEGGGRWERVPAPLSPVPLYFSSLSLFRTALHYLNAWNRLTKIGHAELGRSSRDLSCGSLFITWLCRQVWLPVLGYCEIHDPRIPCRLRPRILSAESRERLNHNQGLAEDNNVLLKSDAEYKNVYHELQSIEMWPTLPSHYPPPPKKGDLISSLLLQYHSNPGNLIVFTVKYV